MTSVTGTGRAPRWYLDWDGARRAVGDLRRRVSLAQSERRNHDGEDGPEERHD